MSIDNIYGTTGVIPQVAVQATDTSSLVGTTYDTNTLTYNTANRYQIANTTAQHNIVFHGPGGKEVGRFDFNEGTVKFEGDANEAAKVFTEWARKSWADLQVKDKTDTLRAVVANLIEESSGELYSEEEKVAILTCIQRVQEMINHLSPTTGVDYAHNFVKQAPLTPAGVQAQVMTAIAPEGKSL